MSMKHFIRVNTSDGHHVFLPYETEETLVSGMSYFAVQLDKKPRRRTKCYLHMGQRLTSEGIRVEPTAAIDLAHVVSVEALSFKQAECQEVR